MVDTKALKDGFQRELEHLATLRDELRLQASLAKTELKTELEHLETRWRHVQEEVHRLTHDPKLKSEIETSVRKVLDELKASYERIKQELKM